MLASSSGEIVSLAIDPTTPTVPNLVHYASKLCPACINTMLLVRKPYQEQEGPYS